MPIACGGRARADIVLMSVTTTAAVEQAILGEARHRLCAAKLDGKVLVDHSTTEIDATKRVAAALDAQDGHGLHRRAGIGRPCGGGRRHARDHGGRRGVGHRPVCGRCWSIWGSSRTWAPVGAGQATKLVNQTLVLANYCVIAEALRLAEAYGVDAAS